MFRKMSEPKKALRGPPAHLAAPPTTCGGPSPLGPISTPTWIRFAILTSVQTVIVPETPEDKCQSHLEHNSSPRLSLQLPGSAGSRTASLYLPWADHTVEGPRVGDWESWLKPEMESHCQAAPYVESNRRPTDQQSSAPRPPSVHRQEEHREILEGLHRGDWSAWTSAEAARSPTNCLCMLLVPVPAWIPGSEQSPEVEAKV